MKQISRRTFALGGVAAGGAALQIAAQTAHALPLVCVFSKPLIKIHYADLGGVLKDLNADGCDLTVRPGGHVEPALAPADLYRAIEAIRAEGVEVPMITTAFVSAADPTLRAVLAIAGRMKVPYFKLGYWRYGPADNILARIAEVRRDVAGMAAQGRLYGMAAGFHNHSGSYVGEAVWDGRAVIEGLDPNWIGYYFDPCHATAEGGEAGWNIAMRMALPRTKMVALKDFYWEKSSGKWTMRMCPLGEGMVDWPQVFALLASARYAGPLSVHIEYEPADILTAIKRDLEFVNKHVAAAWGPGTAPAGDKARDRLSG
ncbi:MAG TPA: sugar phosphate isomerase/epimerase family protein [Bryobacteraceae bacterium]|nr:sugar phosphate isomerase/epimerase family protein [Bryobacteraceae bacterium]